MDIRYSIEAIAPDPDLVDRRQLGVGRHVLGRAPDCELRLAIEGVSRRHAELEILADGGVLVTDLDSTNGTWVDGRPVRRCALSGDFSLQLGACTLRLRAHDPRWSGLAYATGEAGQMPVAGPSAAEVDRTRLLSLGARMRAALAGALPASAAQMEVLSRALQAMLEPLQAQSLCLLDAAGRVQAAAGALDAERIETWRGEHWRLEVDADCRLSESAGRILGALLDWIPAPATARDTDDAAPAPSEFPGVPSVVPAVRRSLAALQRVARSRIGILLLGETGVGKDLVARWIHRCSPRADGPFVAINCAALPEDLLEAELFGVEEGAATGVRARPGVFEQADGGTLFLDELGDMSPRTQVRLLRVLEDGRVHRVGGTALVQVDVRVVGATHRDLARAIAAGEFRSDLYHRLAGFETCLPPLRERAADLPALAIHFYREALEENGLSSPGITLAAMRDLQTWSWPGNVRELRQVVAAAVAGLMPGEALDRMHLPERIRGAASNGPEAVQEPGPDASLAEILAAAERRALVEALEACGGEVEAARLRLGIGKSSFYDKMRKHDLARSAR